MKSTRASIGWTMILLFVAGAGGCLRRPTAHSDGSALSDTLVSLGPRANEVALNSPKAPVLPESVLARKSQQQKIKRVKKSELVSSKLPMPPPQPPQFSDSEILGPATEKIQQATPPAVKLGAPDVVDPGEKKGSGTFCAQHPAGRSRQNVPDPFFSAHLAPVTLPQLNAPSPKFAAVQQPMKLPESGKPAGDLQMLYDLAAKKYDSVHSYIVRFRRRQVINGKTMPEELMLMKFRKQPWSIYLKWLGGAGKQRELVYVQGQFGGKIQMRTAFGDIPFAPAGKRLALSPDSSMIRAKTRRPITEADIGYMIETYGKLVDNHKRGDMRLGMLKYVGLVRRQEFKEPVEAVMQVIAPGAEKDLPRGGRRFLYFDTTIRFPVLLITQDHKQQELEYYCFDRFFTFPSRFSDDEFDPSVLWGRPE